MYDLIVVSFHNRDRATEVLNELWRMNDDWIIEVDDAVALYRDQHGNLEYQQSIASTLGKGVARAGLRGFFLGALVALPFTAGTSAAVGVATLAAGALAGGSIGAAAGALEADLDAAWWKDHFGISDALVRDISSEIGPDDSAILAWIESVDPEMVAHRFCGLGGTVLRTTLTPEQSKRLETVLHYSV
ncbi:MAG: DUF1269 domain-containing protein [Thermoguttaceae bacterium]